MAHILIADDDEIIHELFGAAFRRAGHSVGFVADGSQVLSVLASRHVDLLVLDCNMPMMSGLEVLKRLRTSPEHCLLPVLVLTGHSSPQDRQIAENARADLFCSKASNPDWLVYQAEDLLDRKGRPVEIKSEAERFGLRRMAC